VDEPTQLARRRNLLFATVALLTLTTLSRMGWQRAELFGASWPWDGFDMLLFRCVLLIPIAALAWLAFAVIDPESNLRVIGRGWWKVGWMPSTVFVLLAAWYIAAAFYGPPEVVAKVARIYLTPFYDAPTETIAWGLLLA
jgi:hypothetical protein